MSDPVEDGVRLLRAWLRDAHWSNVTNNELEVVVRNIIAPAVQAERERIRSGIADASWWMRRSDVLAVIDGQR